MSLSAEAEVGAGAFEAFLQGSVFLGQLLDAALEGGVLGGELLDGFAGYQLLDVPELAKLAHQLSDPPLLSEDLGLETRQLFLCVESPLPPRCLDALVLVLGIWSWRLLLSVTVAWTRRRPSVFS
ncbi:hypothetical protein [Streptomyces sp. NPDC002785]|uniref:hypothetical protein n=1 Tax=Streptomyces sp. NPDC002785 TaxID=3154543 RepID=UPI0033328A72